MRATSRLKHGCSIEQAADGPRKRSSKL